MYFLGPENHIPPPPNHFPLPQCANFKFALTTLVFPYYYSLFLFFQIFFLFPVPIFAFISPSSADIPRGGGRVFSVCSFQFAANHRVHC